MQENDNNKEGKNGWFVYVHEDYYDVAGIDSNNDVLVYATIKSFEKAPTNCYEGSQKYLANRLRIGLSTVNKIISKLQKSGAIRSENRVGYTSRLYAVNPPPKKTPISHPYAESTYPPTSNLHDPYAESTYPPTSNLRPIVTVLDRQGEETEENAINVHSCSESLEETPEEFFERAWQYYPNKRGKGQVSEKSKERLMSHGWDNVKRAIDRYIEDLKKDDWRQAQNGSTFFNSRYIDYLDENYTPPMNPKLDYSKTDLDDLFGI